MRSGKAGLPPVRKSLGQHFLTDRRILGHIIDVLAPRSDETIVEVGPGRGALTELLRERAGLVVAIEVDRALAAILRKRYEGDPKVRIVEDDVLRVDLGAIAGGAYGLIGNVPYNITTPILFHALRPPRTSRAVFLVQREVANRMRAAPGGKEYGALTVNLQALTTVRVHFGVPAGAFVPPPRVDSSVVELVPLPHPAVELAEEGPFREMVQAAFGMRRKQMKRVLRGLVPATREVSESILAEVGIDPEARPETLGVPQFVALFRRLRREA
jgi:16S rRNA (adenine1518-N6/adenine1519-N6)-dimethyltransferase